MREKVPLKYLFLLPLICIFSAFAPAERLPLQVFTAADGLASSVIHNITRDSQGFLWFCARGGLSRFDGYEFTSYRLNDEQSSLLIHFFLESRDGKFYWIATDSALYRVEKREMVDVQPVNETTPSGTRRLNAKKVSDRSFWLLHEDRQGRLLAGTSGGLFEIENKETDEISFREIVFSRTAKSEKRASVRKFADGADGSLWVSSDAGLLRRLPDDRWITYEFPRINSIANDALSVRIDDQGRIWTTLQSGLFVLKPEPLEELSNLPDLTARALPIEEIEIAGYGSIALPETSGKMVKLNFVEPLPQEKVRAGQAITSSVQDLYQTADGKMWVPSKIGLYIFENDNYRRLRDTNFLPGTSTQIAEDLQGNLWFGTFGGAVKYARNGLLTFNQAGGLPEPNIHSIQETPEGDLIVVHGTWRVSRLNNNGFETFQLNLPENARFSWTSFPVVQDRAGALWSLETTGLFQFPGQNSFSALVSQSPKKNEQINPLLNVKGIYRAFNDKQGNIWFSIKPGNSPDKTLLRFNPQTGEWVNFSDFEGFPKERTFASFAEDRDGSVWFGFYGSDGIFKFDGERFTEIKTADGLPGGAVLALHVDAKNRLWIASNEEGLTRVDNPAAEKLEFARYTENEGLSSNNVRCLVEDADGNVYAGTVRGVTRLNPETGRTRQITTADGLSADFVQAAFRDKNGSMWFGTSNGLSKLEPQKEKTSLPPRVFISDLKIAGTNYSVSEFGQNAVSGIEVGAAENNLQIGFFGIGEKGNLRYQYKLEGAAQSDWSGLINQRSVNFGNLSPGDYRFLVRAVNDAGAASENPAVVSFKIQPPFWQRWWFVALAFIVVGGAVFVLDRYRVAKTRQVQTALAQSRESENRFRTLADTASDAILTIDADSNIVFVNQAIEKVFGYKPGELIGRKMTILMPERMRGGHNAGLSRYQQRGIKNINWEGVSLPGLHKDGHEIPLEVSFGEFERGGQRYFTGIARDVSERLRAEAELQKSREERFRELERVRTRIATDLHDDIGSSLTQIAVLSEVARGQANFLQAENLSTPLDRIKTVSRELVAVMSDVVWAINPQKDFLHDLVQRMRRFASDVCTGRGIKFEFHAPEVEDKLQLGANIRREVFAIFKEAVNNTVKYSECSIARADFQIENDWLSLKIEDDGKGFDTDEILSDDFKPEMGGNGLVNMKRRAAELGGSCQIESKDGKGTRIVLKIPLHEISSNFEAAAQIGGDNGNGNA